MRVAAAVVLVIAGPRLGSSQTVVRLVERQHTVSIAVVRQHVLEDSDGLLDDVPLKVAIANSTLFLISSRFEPARANITGRRLERLGRQGSGPGEFRTPIHVSVFGDSAVLFDVSLRRATSYTTQGVVLATRPFATLPLSDLVVSGGRLFANASVQTASGIGYPLHQLNLAGEVQRSFGPVTAVGAGPRRWAQRMKLAPAANGGLWAAVQIDYEIHLYDSVGVLARVFRREAGWFPRSERFSIGDSVTPPSPLVVDVREVRPGRLLVLLRVADENWSRGFRTGRRPDGVPEPQVADHNRAYDSVIEVIDLVAGRVLASRRFDETFQGILGTTRLLRFVGTRDEAAGSLELWNIIVDDR